MGFMRLSTHERPVRPPGAATATANDSSFGGQIDALDLLAWHLEKGPFLDLCNCKGHIHMPTNRKSELDFFVQHNDVAH